MLIHEFYMVRKKDIKRNIPYKVLKKRNPVIVNDDFILTHLKEFGDSFESHWYKLENSDRGLNYYGVTIILNKDISDFLNLLYRYKEDSETHNLIKLCEMAMVKNRNIVHFGI